MCVKKFLAWCRGEVVLLTAAVCAAVSAIAVPPSAAYLGYIDLRVLCLLLCLMAVVAGLQRCGVFLVLSQRLLAGEKNVRLLQLLLVLLPFFCLVTGWSVGRRQGVALLYPVACGLLTVPHVFLLYHESALFQAWVAAGFALGGILAGALVRQGKEHAREKT